MIIYNALYALEEVINHISHEPSIVRCQLITSVTSCFKRARECQEMLRTLYLYVGVLCMLISVTFFKY